MIQNGITNIVIQVFIILFLFLDIMYHRNKFLTVKIIELKSQTVNVNQKFSNRKSKVIRKLNQIYQF